MMVLRLTVFFLQCVSFLCLRISTLEASQDFFQEDSRQERYQLVVCAIFQDETFFLKEWLEYHLLVGVEHFYLYDNLSTDAFMDILTPYIENGTVELFDWPVQPSNQREYLDLLQLPAYEDALTRVKGVAKWAAFIDLDEFLVPLRHKKLSEMLQHYEDYPALAINWQVFGTSGVNDLLPNKLLIEQLIKKAPSCQGMNEIVKLIVQPNLVESIPNPHAFHYTLNRSAVNSQGVPLKPNQMGQPVVLDTVQINHYWFGTYNWFFQNKIPRRNKWGIKLTQEQLEELISLYNSETDTAIHKFIEPLKKTMLP